jgi:UDP-glucose 4-epimerase
VKVFVTGGAGYVGSICVEQLLDRGHEVVVFGNLSEGHRESIDPRATFIQGDLNDPKSISRAIKTSDPSAVMFGEVHRTERHLIPRILQVALGKLPHAEIFGTDFDTPNGTCIRDYVHVLDLASAHILALSAEKSDSFNLGSGGGTSVKEVLKTCRQVSGRSIPAIEKVRRPGDPPRLVASSEKAKQELNWNPQFAGIEAIVESAWQWHAAHPNGYSD